MTVVHKPRNILFTGDVLRPDKTGNASCQTVNIHWLFNLFQWQIEQASGMKPEFMSWGPAPIKFNSKIFYELNGLRPSEENWSIIFCSDNLHPLAEEYYLSFVEDALLVSFELPNCLIKLLQRNGIPYIDFTIHPVRFLDDIFLAVRTNIKDCSKFLEEHSCQEDIFYVEASVHAASLNRMGSPKIPNNCALLVGQTSVDKSLLQNGSIRSLLDYKEELSLLSEKYEKLLFKPHPVQSSVSIEQLKEIVPNIAITSENAYRLICSPSVSHVYGISSSILSECRYFTKPSSYFYKPPFQHWEIEKRENDGWLFYPIYQDYFSPMFWRGLLNPLSLAKPCSDISIPHKENRLRLSLQEFWGYGFLEFEPYNLVQQKYEQSRAVA